MFSHIVYVFFYDFSLINVGIDFPSFFIKKIFNKKVNSDNNFFCGVGGLGKGLWKLRLLLEMVDSIFQLFESRDFHKPTPHYLN